MNSLLQPTERKRMKETTRENVSRLIDVTYFAPRHKSTSRYSIYFVLLFHAIHLKKVVERIRING